MNYPKIETLFKRDENFKVIEGEYKNRVIPLISSWQWTEKIDGTNVRVILQPDGRVVFRGRTDNGLLHPELIKYLESVFIPDKLKSIFWKEEVYPFQVILFGEGYGAGIQKGAGYNPKKVFRLFDVLIDKWWLNWDSICDVANKIGVKTVPFLFDGSIDDAIWFCKGGFNSIVSMEDSNNMHMAEGIVGRTVEPLFDKRGNRLIIKLKTKDFNIGT